MTDSIPPTRRNVLLGIGAAGAISLAGCAGGNAGDGDGDPTTDGTTTSAAPGSAMVRVGHASPNAPNVDVYVNGGAVLEDVPFGAVSGYLDLPAGSHAVEITAAGDPDAVVFSGDVTVESDSAYTIVATGEIGDMADEPFEPVILADDNTDPGSDTARLQLLHASPDAPAVDVTVRSSGDALFDGVAFGESGTVEVPAGSYTVQVRGDTDGNDGDIVAEYDLTLEGGTVYTGLAVGYLSPDDEPADTPFALRVATSEGGAGTARTPTATPTPDPAHVRVVHASPNAPNVDVWVNGTAVLEDVTFGAISAYLDLPAGTHTVEIAAAGDPETVVFSGDLTVDAGTAYTVVAAGEIGDMADEPFAPLVLTDDNSDPGTDSARVRLVHASPDAPAVDVTLASSGDALFDGVPFGGAGYVEVPAGDYTIDVRGDTETNDGDVVASFDLSLAGGQVYTGVAAGYLSPADEPADTPFDLLLAQDTDSM
ncbi:MAG: DUF4397 domain-containing protein [Haloarculaceae archaeon]